MSNPGCFDLGAGGDENIRWLEADWNQEDHDSSTQELDKEGRCFARPMVISHSCCVESRDATLRASLSLRSQLRLEMQHYACLLSLRSRSVCPIVVLTHQLALIQLMLFCQVSLEAEVLRRYWIVDRSRVLPADAQEYVVDAEKVYLPGNLSASEVPC